MNSRDASIDAVDICEERLARLISATHMRVKLKPFHTPSRSRHLSRALVDLLEKGAPIDIHPEVEDALATNKPVVALESTIITHGMPQVLN